MRGIADQYRIIESGAGWRRRIERGRLRFDGADRLAFLQALITNDVGTLAPGQGCYAAYLTPQGRMIADLHVFARQEHLVADVPAANAAALADAFDRLIFTEQVQVEDVSQRLTQISIVGGAAGSIAAAALGLDTKDLRSLSIWSHAGTATGFVVKTDATSLDSYDIVMPAGDESTIAAALQQAGAIELSNDLWTSLRIDAGRPEFGADMDTDTIPLESGLLERAISTSKGCYVGQEVIIRVLHRGGGRVARRLVKLDVDAALPPPAGASIRSGDRDVGRVTSAALSPDGTKIIALAYVHRDVAQPGQVVAVEHSGTVSAIIAALAG